MGNTNTDLEIMKELHPTKNRNITINNIKRKMKVWWLCSKCNYEWKTTISKRTSGKQSCPRCVGKVVSEYNCLENCYKELIKQWHPTKNGTLTPKDFCAKSNKKMWWLCPKCNHEWKTQIIVRTRIKGSDCPKCVRKHHISKSSSKWLDELKISSEYREFLIRINKKRFIVDGYDPLTKTIYEYFGNYWHGNPNMFNPDDIHPVRKIKFGIIYQETIDRIKLFEENGYKIIYKWGD